MNDKQAYGIIFTCWLTATIATLGSLFFSEIMEFVPCTLCWYQRIFMYPLVILFLISLYRFEKSILLYSFPFIILGWFFALYHNLVQLEIIPESASPCVQGIPCSTKYINWLNFITIPALSFFAFSILLILIIIFYKGYYNEKK
ncbi:MAG: disulfide oxidoreductase [Leptospirales bacterium]